MRWSGEVILRFCFTFFQCRHNIYVSLTFSKHLIPGEFVYFVNIIPNKVIIKVVLVTKKKYWPFVTDFLFCH